MLFLGMRWFFRENYSDYSFETQDITSSLQNIQGDSDVFNITKVLHFRDNRRNVFTSCTTACLFLKKI